MTDLGRTRDPTELIPGNPAGIRAAAQTLRARARRAEQAGDGLARIDAGGWEGEAAQVFRERFSYEPAKWYAAANSLDTAADALSTYAEVLEWAQARAAEAVGLWDEAEVASRVAEHRHDGPEPFVDPGVAVRLAARDATPSAVWCGASTS